MNGMNTRPGSGSVNAVRIRTAQAAGLSLSEAALQHNPLEYE
jgi:hypothetical protein